MDAFIPLGHFCCCPGRLSVIEICDDTKGEVVVATDSVAFLVCNKDRDEVLLAIQDRAPMLLADNPQGHDSGSWRGPFRHHDRRPRAGREGTQGGTGRDRDRG